MRLWSLHPAMLDRAGLTALWREALLAQAVLAGRTRGYTRHPQLERFRATGDPIGAIGAYLAAVAAEARSRGYRFDTARIDRVAEVRMPVTAGQVELEMRHLRAKLVVRDPDRLETWRERPRTHPMLDVVPGAVEPWERADV